MKSTLSPKQVARAIGSSEASLKRWCDKGVIQAVRTAGGHRRIPVSSVIHFLRETGRPLTNPELLGLPSTVGQGPKPERRALTSITEAIESGDEDRFRAAIMELYLSGKSVCDICDQIIAPAFENIGDRWEHGDVEIYQERRGVEICTRTLIELRTAFHQPSEDAPYALGATLENDPYTLPTTMAEVVLREAGWRAESLGAGHPLKTLRAALFDRKPRLVWISFSVLPPDVNWISEWTSFFDYASGEKIAVVVGGRGLKSGHGLKEDIRSRIPYSAHCDRLSHLVSFAHSLSS